MKSAPQQLLKQDSQEYKIVDNYVVTSITLGRGAFGIVKRGYIQNDPKTLVAVKVMPIDKVNQDKNFVKLLKRELEILPKVENPYIVKLYHAARTKNNFYMFLEYCNGGDLKELLKKRGKKLSEAEAVTYFRHIVEGFKGIHQENVIHRDIKPANILLHDGIAKISDFGFARVVTDMEQVDQFTLLGTPLYMPPQILTGQKFSSKCDVWSLGMMFYELLYGQTPWNANTQASLATCINNTPLSFPEHPKRSPMVKEIIVKMLQSDEDKRISWHELFVCDLVRFDDKALVKNIEQITAEQDPLDRSVKWNEMYVDNNRVMDKATNPRIQNFFTENRPQNQESDGLDIASNQGSQISVPSSIEGSKHEHILAAQNKQINQTHIIVKIDSYLTFNRNVGIFVNFTTNQIFRLFKEQLIKIPNHLFYRIIFLLQKYQMIQFQNLIDIMASKVPIGQGFDENDWKLYKKSKEYFQTLHAIKNDTHFIRPYFNEIFQRTSDFLTASKATFTPIETQEIKEFQVVLTKEFHKDQMPFFAVFNSTLAEALKRFAYTLQGDPKLRENRSFLQTALYLKICKDPFKTFKWEDYQPMEIHLDNTDEKKEFNQFYEYYDILDLNKLLLEVKEALTPYQ